MRTSLKWIKDLVPGLDVTPREYMDALTLSGSKVEFYEEMDANLDKIVVGQINTIEKHPDADKLVVCSVDIGSDNIQIVTAAKNVKEGDKVPVVLDGGTVLDGTKPVKIKTGKLRGVKSQGMFCSIQELGSNTDMYPEACEDGIYIFSDDVKVGDDAVKLLGRDDVVVEYEITSNRVDCFGVLGIAREAAATFNKEFSPVVVTKTGNDEDVNDYIKVKIDNEKLCLRYTARVVKDIKIAPSPVWMQRRLMAQGIRPINNIVDITNYVMEEYGQPMHAYDLDTIEDNTIIVRNAVNGEKFTTLDSQTRDLDESVLMICDGKKPVGIAGIMGGENSMITDDVKTMLFESACFDGANIRISSKKVGLRTDASSKFEKGLDPNNAILAIDRACQLVEELNAGTVVGGVVDVYPVKREEITLDFEPDRYNKILGTDISAEKMKEYFARLELKVENEKVIVPTFRQDILSYADLAEEVARFYGYDKIPTSLPSGEATAGKLSYKLKLENIIKDTVEHNGFSQAMCYSFESPKVFDKLLLPEDSSYRQTVVIDNPLGEDYSIMRTLPLDGMLTSLSTNYNHRNKDVRLYELGNVYIPKSLPIEELPDERMMLTLGMLGDGDFYTLKGVVEDVLDSMNMNDKRIYDSSDKISFLHPGRGAHIIYKGKRIGYLGEVHPTVASNYSIKDRVYIAVLDTVLLRDLASFDTKYEPVAKFPSANRDISMVVPRDILASQIEDIFDSKGGSYLESYELFDIYEGNQILSGHKSMAYSLVFRAKDKNLSDEEVNIIMERIIKALNKIGVKLRS